MTKSGDMFRLSIHQGSVRSGVFECMNDESLEMWIWDSHDAMPVDEVSVDDIINWVKDNLKKISIEICLLVILMVILNSILICRT